MLIDNDLVKGIMAAIAAAVVAQVNSLLEILTDPKSPKNVITEGQKTIQLIDAWAQARGRLQQLESGPQRDRAQSDIDLIVETLHESQQSFAELREARRRQLFRVMSYFRLQLPKGWLRGIAAFLFYVSLVMLVQSIHIYVRDSTYNPWAIAPFAGATALFWLLSWPKK